MSLDYYMQLSLQVLADWRIIAVALGSILVWALLRYVGMVYYRRPKPKRRPSAAKKQAAPKPAPRQEAEIEEE